MKITWVLLALILSGCGIRTASNQNGAYIMAWDSNMSAAVAPPVGRPMCMQFALTSEDKKNETDVKLTDAIGSVIYKLPTADANAKDLITVSNDLLKTTKALNVSTEKTAFLIAGGFYLCQLQMNGMDQKDVKELASEWLRLSSNLATTREVKTEADGKKPARTETTTTTTSGVAQEPVPIVLPLPAVPSVSAATGTNGTN
jgi:hypothetical protein